MASRVSAADVGRVKASTAVVGGEAGGLKSSWFDEGARVRRDGTPRSQQTSMRSKRARHADRATRTQRVLGCTHRYDWEQFLPAILRLFFIRKI